MIEKERIGGLCIKLRRLRDQERRGLLRPEDQAQMDEIIKTLNTIGGGDLLLEIHRIKTGSGLVVL